MSNTHCRELLDEVKVNREIMSDQQIKMLDDILMENIKAFNEDLSEGYCKKSQPHEATFSFRKENKAPPYKIWVPQFNRRCQDLLQSKCDELEASGVLVDPKEHGNDNRHQSGEV